MHYNWSIILKCKINKNKNNFTNIQNKIKKFHFLKKICFCVLIIFLWVTLQVIERSKEDKIYIMQINREKTLNEKIKEASRYYELCIKGKLINKKKYKKANKPSLSIIIPVYNREKYLLTSLRSIQNQNMKELEIVIIDDCSTDNSTNLIKQLQKEEERIVFIQNLKNRGSLTTRIIGVLNSRGEYIKFMDSDDLLLPILHICYKYAVKYKIEIIEHNIVYKVVNNFSGLNHNHPNEIIFNENIMNVIGLVQTNGHYFLHVFLWSYFIERSTMFKAIDFIGDYYVNQHVCWTEDWAITYAILKKGKSYKFLENDYGYIYNAEYIGKKEYGRNFNNYFVFLKFFFERSSNSYDEKKICDGFFYNAISMIENNPDILTKENENIIKLYLNCEFIPKESKNKYLNVEKKIKQRYYNSTNNNI